MLARAAGISLICSLWSTAAVARPKWTTTRAELRRGAMGAADGSAHASYAGVRKRLVTQRNGKVVQAVTKVDRHTVDHEVAAYALSLAAGFDFVPPTSVTPSAEGGAKMMRQAFVQGDMSPTYEIMADSFFADVPQLIRLNVFDYLIQNPDRHAWNWLVQTNDGEKSLVAIDHSYNTFPDAGSDGVPAYGQLRMKLSGGHAIDEGNRQFIERISPRRVAVSLRAAGLPRAKVQGVLQRLEYLKQAFPSLASGATANTSTSLASLNPAAQARIAAALAGL